MESHYTSSVSKLLAIGILLSALPVRADLTATGYAQYSGLSEDLFLTSLFVDATQKDKKIAQFDTSVRRLEFKFLGQQLSFRRFKRLLLQSSAINNPPEFMKSNASAINEFVKRTHLKGSFQRGDHLIFKSDTNGLTTIFNAVELSVVKSPNLFDMLLNSWVGKIPPSREFKYALLGETKNPEVERVFNTLTYSASRREEILLSHNVVISEKGEDEARNQLADVVAEKEKSVSENRRASAKPNTEKIGKKEEEKNASSITIATSVPAGKTGKESRVTKTVTEVLAPDDTIFTLAATKRKDLEPKKIEIKQTLASIDDKPRSIFVDSEFEDARESRNAFSRELYLHASKNIFYPKRSRQLKHTGKVLAQVTIDRDGVLLDVELGTKSPHNSLNKAVQKALRKSQPYPKVPDTIGGDSFIFEVPVTFSL